MKLRILLSTGLILSSASNALAEDSLKEQARQIIVSQGYWCGRVVSITPTLFGQTANKNTYRIFCDDGREVANYEMEIGRNGGYVKVREK